MNQKDLDTPATKRDLEILAAQIIQAVGKALEKVASKEDMDKLDRRVGGLEEKVGGLEEKVGGLEEKVGGLEEKVGGLEEKVDKLQSDVTDIKRRVIDIEVDTPTKEEFSDLKEKVDSIYARRLSQK